MSAAKKARASGPSGKHRTGCAVYLHCDPEQRERWREAAIADGRDLSSWLRVVADRAASKSPQTRGGRK